MAKRQYSEEEIKNMSPEEFKEYQKSECVFCHIVSGEVQSRKVFEDDDIICILDINPANPGHVLILPKEHYAIMPQIPDQVVGRLFQVAKAISQILLKALQVKGTNIFVANGLVAGQKAQHFMIHVIPRKEGDGLNFSIPERSVSASDLEKIRLTLVKTVNKMFGLSDEDFAAESYPKEQIADFSDIPASSKAQTLENEPVAQNENKITVNDLSIDSYRKSKSSANLDVIADFVVKNPPGKTRDDDEG